MSYTFQLLLNKFTQFLIGHCQVNLSLFCTVGVVNVESVMMFKRYCTGVVNFMLVHNDLFERAKEREG